MLANRAASEQLWIAVRPLDPGMHASCDRANRVVTISEALAAEDPRVVASARAHEPQHSVDVDLAMLGVLPGDCLTIESRGFATRAVVARELYGDELPRGTPLERGRGATSGAASTAPARDWRRPPSYRETCAALDAAAR
jgi:hypothetical protein